jgi:hypothetical protein
MRKLGLVMVLSLALTLLLAVPAAASTEQVSQQSSTVTGADAATAAFRDIERIQLGTQTTTVTVASQGVPHDVVVDYAGIMSPTREDGSTNPVMPLLTLSVGAVALRSVLRLIQTLARFQRRS